ncbi:hypothetical protein AAG747_06655 [Rapidithrix thailandica]|uniref:Lipoprotein n=1 Tax=Rapidithrix thailandica TaxID=413964 RepID=A0AAW9S8C9_9BACT
MKRFLLCFCILWSACSQVAEKNTKQASEQTEPSPEKLEPSSQNETQATSFQQLLSNVSSQKLPYTDSTNFDNFNKEDYLTKEQMRLLQLHKIYPEMDKEGFTLKAVLSYRLDLSVEYTTLVVIVFKGDHEMESQLINYDTQEQLIDHLTISYDEIAEGWSRKESLVGKEKITVTDILWMEEKQVEITEYLLDTKGNINPVKS